MKIAKRGRIIGPFRLAVPFYANTLLDVIILPRTELSLKNSFYFYDTIKTILG